jgi:hypothetical protein
MLLTAFGSGADLPGAAEFDEWLDSIFNHPITEPNWYLIQEWEMNWAGDPNLFLAQSIRLFRDPEVLLDRYDAEQIEQGFRYLLFWAGGLERWIWAKEIESTLRRACVISMVNVFDRLFSRNSFGEACFMWWDHLRESSRYSDPEIETAILEALSKILELNSPECQISALHGLGHLKNPAKTKLIDRFLDLHPHLDKKTRQYAEAAKHGRTL